MLIDKFLKYISYDTQSSDNSNTYPSTSKQLILAKELYNELEALNFQTSLDKYGYVKSIIKGNVNGPKIGFIAHYDTALEVSGKNIKPRIIKNYNGDFLLINKNIVLDINHYPLLENFINHDLIITDGKTLLGADDKAGLTIIMEMAKKISDNPNLEHGDITILFTPDEEVGDGTKYLNIQDLDLDFAYTIDGSLVNEISYENFNAALAKITFNGVSIHPGDAKGKMVNAILLSMEFNSLLPPNEIPAHTENYEGFFHLNELNGTVEKTQANYLIRNHDNLRFNNQKQTMLDIANYLNKKYQYKAVNIQITDTYHNMFNIIKDKMTSVNLAIDAMKEIKIIPKIIPTRGGTDGANLTQKGIPTPNLGTGSIYHHSRYEIASINQMELAVSLLLKIIELSTNIR